MVDFKKLVKQAVANGADQTKSVSGGGGDYVPPEAGPALVRFMGYVELGKQNGTYKGKPTVKEKVELIFELVGKRHPPIIMQDGTKIPQRIGITESLSLNEKAHFFKLFNRMNYAQDKQHIGECLGDGYKAVVVHDKWTGQDGKERITATLKDENGWTVVPPRREALEEEESTTGWVNIEVPPAIGDQKCFLWNEADLEQWASLFIEGEYPERTDEKTKKVIPAKSKNTLQAKVKKAVNFQGSPIHALLLSNGIPLDIPDVGEEDERGEEGNEQAGAASAKAPAQQSSTTSPSNDPLTGIV